MFSLLKRRRWRRTKIIFLAAGFYDCRLEEIEKKRKMRADILRCLDLRIQKREVKPTTVLGALLDEGEKSCLLEIATEPCVSVCVSYLMGWVGSLLRRALCSADSCSHLKWRLQSKPWGAKSLPVIDAVDAFSNRTPPPLLSSQEINISD